VIAAAPRIDHALRFTVAETRRELVRLRCPRRPGWNNADLRALKRLSGGDFEVVDTRSLPRPGA